MITDPPQLHQPLTCSWMKTCCRLALELGFGSIKHTRSVTWEPIGGSIPILVLYTVSNRLHQSRDTDRTVVTLRNISTEEPLRVRDATKGEEGLPGFDCRHFGSAVEEDRGRGDRRVVAGFLLSTGADRSV